MLADESNVGPADPHVDDALSELRASAEGLRVLVVHNHYRSQMASGENQAVKSDVAMLRSVGAEVDCYERSSDEIEGFGVLRRAELGIRPLFSLEDTHRLAGIIDRFQPSVVHLHNPFPLISPSVVRVARSRRVPVVQSVYNFRHVCMSGILFRDGEICEDCYAHRLKWPGVVHGCYRGSVAQSVVMATAMAVHRRTWGLVDRFLPVSEFVAAHLRRVGIRPSRLHVRSNPVSDPGPPRPLGEGFLFGGRLTEEKGIVELLDAWRQADLGKITTLTIAGDGPLRPHVEQAANRLPGISYVGGVKEAEMESLRRSAAVVVVPSKWYEGLPLVALEAFAAGRPVLASNIGGLTELVDDQVGWSAAPTASSLARTLVDAHRCVDVARRGRRARERFEDRYSPVATLRSLLSAYGSLAG